MSSASELAEPRAPSAAEPWPASPRAWWAVAVFCLAAVLSYTDRQILSLLVAPLRAELHISDTQISLLQGLAFALIYSVSGLPLGRLADIWPRRAVIVAGVSTWTLATVACGLAQSFHTLFLARIFVGIGEAALAPAAMSMITDLFPPQRRGTAIGVFLMGMMVGSGVALGVGGSLLEAAEAGLFRHLPVLGEAAPWRATMLLLAAPGVFICLLLLTVKEPKRRGGEDGSAARSLNAGQALYALFERRRVVGPLLLAMAALSAGDFALLNWTPALLSRNYHLHPGQIGVLVGGVAIAAGVVGTLIGGALSDRLAKSGATYRRAALSGMGAVLALPAALVWICPNPLTIMLCFGLWNLVSSGAGAAGITAVQEAVPNETRGLSISSIAFCNMIFGLGFGTLAVALLTEHVFRDPLALAQSMALVVGPGAALGSLFFWRAARAMRAGS
jgi:MFS family permease